MFYRKGSVFLLNRRYAAHVALRIRPPLGGFGEESFESRGSDIDEHTNRLIRIVLESVDRAAGGINAIPREHVGPSIVQKKTNPAFDDIEPFVFVFVVVRAGTTPRWSDVEKRRELPAGLFAVEQYDHCVAKRTQRAAFVGSFQERTVDR